MQESCSITSCATPTAGLLWSCVINWQELEIWIFVHQKKQKRPGFIWNNTVTPHAFVPAVGCHMSVSIHRWPIKHFSQTLTGDQHIPQTKWTDFVLWLAIYTQTQHMTQSLMSSLYLLTQCVTCWQFPDQIHFLLGYDFNVIFVSGSSVGMWFVKVGPIFYLGSNRWKNQIKLWPCSLSDKLPAEGQEAMWHKYRIVVSWMSWLGQRPLE